MKTEDLIALLATDAGAVEAPALGQRYAAAIGWGVLGASLLMLCSCRSARISGKRSGYRCSGSRWALSLVLPREDCLPRSACRVRVRKSIGCRSHLASRSGIWSIAAVVLMEAEPMERSKLFFGETWKSCPLLIAMLSIPVFAAVIRVMKELAPTRLRLAGFAAGLLSGSVAAVVYCLHCPEMGAPFIGFWYLLGALIPAGVGALLGNTVLRW
jgi:hypothetical protein